MSKHDPYGLTAPCEVTSEFYCHHYRGGINDSAAPTFRKAMLDEIIAAVTNWTYASPEILDDAQVHYVLHHTEQNNEEISQLQDRIRLLEKKNEELACTIDAEMKSHAKIGA